MASMGSFGSGGGESQTIRQRIKIAGFIAGVLALIIFIRLYSLQVQEYSRYQTLSLGNHIRLQALAPVRGLILDRHGVVLAQNTAVYTLQVIPEKIKDIEAMLNEVSQIVELSEA